MKDLNYGLEMIGVKNMWKHSFLGEGVVVAVIDSGVEKEHRAIRSNIIGGFNFTNDDGGEENKYIDYIGHGTHVAGIIAGYDRDLKKIIGVAPLAKLLILKIIDKDGQATIDNACKAIEYALNWRGENGEKVNVMNMSFGTNKDSEHLKSLIKETYSKNVIMVASSGNYGDGNALTNELLYPAYYKEVIEVGAVKQNFEIYDYSNSNDEIDFVAPGYKILSSYLNETYVKLSGTSMATPHVSGAMALLINKFQKEDKEINYKSFYSYLRKDAKKLNYPITLQGHGLIQFKNSTI
ncbi:S8 family peptidase [Priestia megaterium]|uniref:S8 family peptidase n=1 Tax=Priestia megaterium TaxID=1404 RepID=UPI001BE862C9|nr:S8 family peptidase [Priestia megaterium]MBT2259178.1 S8 family peptidase [Priestia megaterium]MBT2279769.1 S8 family peptidase [Priestia megaterium]